MFYFFLVLNACLGAFLFERAWANTKRQREVSEERDRHFPAWRRHDAPKWKKWQMYPFAVTILIPRLLAGVCCLLLTVIINNILMLGVDFKKPIPTWRRSISKVGYAVGCGLASLCFGMIAVPSFPATDYT